MESKLYMVEVTGLRPFLNVTGIERTPFGNATRITFVDSDGDHAEIITRERLWLFK